MKRLTAGLILWGALIILPAQAKAQEAGMILTSPEFKNNGSIPKRFTCEGEDINPLLEIQEIPAQAKSLVLIIDDPDAPAGTWTHWVVFNIPPGPEIKENSIPGKQASNSLNQEDYHGPCPPSGTHRYFFKIFALDTLLEIPQGASRGAVEKAMQGHILDKAELVGLYRKV